VGRAKKLRRKVMRGVGSEDTKKTTNDQKQADRISSERRKSKRGGETS